MHEEANDEPIADPRAPRARRMDELGTVIDRIARVDRLLATISAQRAELIETARRLSVADCIATAEEFGAATAALDESRRRVGWSRQAIAQRELVTEIASALRVPERTADALIDHSRALVNELPATARALKAGQISYRHAQTLIDHARTLPADAYRAFEVRVLPDAKALTVAKFDRRARDTRERVHPESIALRTAIARADRTVTLEHSCDGMAWLSALLPAEAATAAYLRVREIAGGLKTSDEKRSLAQLSADVISDLLIDGVTEEQVDGHEAALHRAERTVAAFASVEGLDDQEFAAIGSMQGTLADVTGERPTFETIVAGLRADAERERVELRGRCTRRIREPIGRGIRAKVLVTVPVFTLLGSSEEPATLEGYGPIDADTARRLAAHAPSFTRILTQPESGAVLSVGRESYAVLADLRNWLRVRDETCRFVGCNRVAGRCEIDHSVDWALGGLTDHDNLAHLCPSHHHVKHHTDWRVEHRRGGVLQWTSPTGRRHRTDPAHRTDAPRFS